MADLILHHYPTSPFAEKIRTVLGFKQLAWKSVLIPPVLPKPDVVALTGGYRRTPVLQIGADIYCDTALICDVLEHIAPVPALYPPLHKGMARTLAQWGDTTLFWTSMAYNFQPKGLADLFGAAPELGKAFADDRRAMSTNMTRLRPQDATGAYKSYLRRVSETLGSQDFVMGEVPTLADFSLYHPLWFTRVRTPSLAGILELTPAVLQWMDRMAALGHGTPEKFDAESAIQRAASSVPASLLTDSTFQDDHGIALGARVTIAAESFGAETTEGELVAATRTHFTLRREDARAGTVQVHFPRIGYVLKKVETPA
ncbi:glutathione S-transferase family protein [Variovorax sp.]|uniref:glutathione S-transferase family protein n=1 Tax=Variovorax sp. TaxID=1871043 RepID=UPI002D54AA15|nr:glutathione S-transferase family protein [Variovorax sp.]HYP86039.1 glutathione S-transferase family protein [Variovorax sp.]